jgi:hypothetical protein
MGIFSELHIPQAFERASGYSMEGIRFALGVGIRDRIISSRSTHRCLVMHQISPKAQMSMNDIVIYYLSCVLISRK